MDNLKFITQKEIQDAGYVVQNGTLKNLDIELNLHFGNCVSLIGIVECENGKTINPFGFRNSTKEIGSILQTVFDVLDLSRDDGRKLSSIKDVPCRIVIRKYGIYDAWDSCIGIGSAEKDKFVYIEDLMKGRF